MPGTAPQPRVGSESNGPQSTRPVGGSSRTRMRQHRRQAHRTSKSRRRVTWAVMDGPDGSRGGAARGRAGESPCWLADPALPGRDGPARPRRDRSRRGRLRRAHPCPAAGWPGDLPTARDPRDQGPGPLRPAALLKPGRAQVLQSRPAPAAVAAEQVVAHGHPPARPVRCLRRRCPPRRPRRRPRDPAPSESWPAGTGRPESAARCRRHRYNQKENPQPQAEVNLLHERDTRAWCSTHNSSCRLGKPAGQPVTVKVADATLPLRRPLAWKVSFLPG
jgi:hypothetical protein